MNTIVFTFGRFNPPTKGHERLVSKVVETAKNIGADHLVVLSQSQKSGTDPLEWNFKRRICENAFPGVNISSDVSIYNPFKALQSFQGKYDKVILVVGSDQVDEFAERMTPYAKEWGFDFEIISAGDRNNNSGVEGMSATKMRNYAIEHNWAAFSDGLPSKLRGLAKRLVFEETKRGMKKPRK
jgi:hypothetical protein